MKKFILFFLLATAVTIYFAYAQSPVSTGTKKEIILPGEKIDLKPGEDMDKVVASCNICHSLDYIPMQPKGTKAKWTAEVDKMIKVYGAPITVDNAKVIAAYLATNYGTGM